MKPDSTQFVGHELVADEGDRRHALCHALDLRIGVIAHLHLADREISLAERRQHLVVGQAVQPVKADAAAPRAQPLDGPLDLARAFDAGLVGGVDDGEVAVPGMA